MKYHVLIKTNSTSIKARINEGEILLDVLLQNGIKHPYSCRSGACGTCRCKLLKGKISMIEYSQSALRDEERNQGFILACRTKAETDLVIELPWLDIRHEEPDDLPPV